MEILVKRQEFDKLKEEVETLKRRQSQVTVTDVYLWITWACVLILMNESPTFQHINNWISHCLGRCW